MSGNPIKQVANVINPVKQITNPIKHARDVGGMAMGAVEGVGSLVQGLLPKQEAPAPVEAPGLPAREDVINTVLQEQLDMINKRRSRLGGSIQSADTAPVASSLLFGA